MFCLFSVGRTAFAAEMIDQSNLPEWAGGWTHISPDPNGDAGMWQTFTPARPNITAVEIDILTITAGRGNDTLTIEIAKDGEISASDQRYVEDGFDGLLRFEFDEAIAVLPGELYELKVRDTGLTRFGWKYASNTYERGSRYVFADERPGTDWLFRTYSNVEPHIIYVDDDAAGANNGTSWENAYVYLQYALACANLAEKPIEIRIAQGIYRPNHGLAAIPEFEWRTTTFQLINGVAIKGGYAGLYMPDPNARDIEMYETILSGDLYGDDAHVADPCDLPNEPTHAENCFHVVTANRVDETAVLDGLVITGGNADFVLDLVGGGGMVNYNNSSPTLTNCTFRANSSKYGAGGLANFENSRPAITNCTFNGNTSMFGGGGGISNFTNSSPTLTACIFSRNYADFGGGMCNFASSPILINCTFAQNAAENGNALASDVIYDNQRIDLNNVELTNCILWDGGNEIWNNDNSTINITYSNIQDGFPGEGNIDADPLFASAGYWADVNDPNAVWVDGDYHLKSQAGRWDRVSESWVIDDVTSPCIDAGDPNMPVGDEPEPNGGRINMGAYGGTAEASKSITSELFQTSQELIRAYGFKYGK
jgi:hypothetical protein